MTQDDSLEKRRALYGMLAVIFTNLAIAGVAIFGVWRLGGDTAVIVGVLTSAFTAVSGVTTAYLGIKAVSNTARAMSIQQTSQQESQQTSQQASAAPAQEQAGSEPAKTPAPRTP